MTCLGELLSRGIMLLGIVLCCCLLFVVTPGVVTPGTQASIIRRRGYIPADGAPVANYRYRYYGS